MVMVGRWSADEQQRFLQEVKGWTALLEAFGTHVERTVHGGGPAHRAPQQGVRVLAQEDLQHALWDVRDEDAWAVLRTIYAGLEALLPTYPSLEFPLRRAAARFPASTSPRGPTCAACGVYAGSGPIDRCRTCGEFVHEECMSTHKDTHGRDEISHTSET
jgi:hypothetical protein